MAAVEFTFDEHVALLTLNDGENRFNPAFLDALLKALDEIEQTQATTLVVTSAHEKIFCNGIDLEWLAPVLQKKDVQTAKAFFYHLNRVFKRLVTYPLVTIAAINGHAFAGGAIISCAFDFRFMRSDRGFFCLPEVDLGIPFLPGMNALLSNAIAPHALRELEFSGARWTAEMCQAHHIVRKACPKEELMPEVLAFARQINKKRNTVAEMKARLYRPIIQAIEVEDVPYIESGGFFIV